MLNPKTVRLVRGESEHPSEGACLEQLVTLLAGEPFSDNPKCACPVIVAFGLRTNDWISDEARPRLYEFAVRQIGTRDDGRMVERAFMCADWAVREVAALSHPELAKLPPIVDEETARHAAATAHAANATYAAYAAAAAVADAADAAYYANDAAGHAANAAAHAARAAATTLAAATTATARPTIAHLTDMRIELLDRLCPPWPSITDLDALDWDTAREAVCQA